MPTVQQATPDPASALASVCVGFTASEKYTGSAASTSVYQGSLVSPSTASFGNGYDVTGAQFGSSNIGEAAIYQVDFSPTHGNTTDITALLTTAYAAGNEIKIIKHEVNKKYWLKMNSGTTLLHSKLIPAANGLVSVSLAHSSAGVSMHVWDCTMPITAGTWTQGIYMGIQYIFTS